MSHLWGVLCYTGQGEGVVTGMVVVGSGWWLAISLGGVDRVDGGVGG